MFIYAVFMCFLRGGQVVHCQQYDPGIVSAVTGEFIPGTVYRSTAECQRSLLHPPSANIRLFCLRRHVDTWGE